MCCPEIEHRSFGDDAGGVNGWVTHIIVALDVYEIDGLCHAGLLKEFARVIPEIWLIDQRSQIKFEVAIVN